MEMTGHEQLSAIKSAAEACIIAGRTDLIVQAIDQAWWNGKAAATTWLVNRIAAERAPQPAARPASTTTATAPAPGGSLFGPTAEQRDALTMAIEARYAQMYPKPESQ